MMQRREKSKSGRFVLSVKNQNGQVGIFIALIFQVIFVFFAMLINVGLVVHHKINLQQSTDLAAYYGAMKQAEIMNVMAHVNYQIRQAWKLMTWRYRVLGTFGLERNGQGSNPNNRIEFPIEWQNTGKLPTYNINSRSFACPPSAGTNAAGLTITDVPFMCLGHNGFGDWISAATDQQDETFCKIDCKTLDSMAAFSIDKILGVDTGTVFDYNFGKPINDAIIRANEIIENVCNKLGPTSVRMLGLYYRNYIVDTQDRKSFIFMLNKNLGLPEDQMLDIEGNKVLDGVLKTLRNNLTEANLSSLTPTSISTLNGAKGFTEAMLQDVNFQRLLFFLVNCNYVNKADVKVTDLYGPGGLLSTDLVTNLQNAGENVSSIQDIFQLNSEQSNTIGYEKNPWIQVYYGVKATSEPKIPFLPLSKIKLHAISFAKPFGGTMGPWYFKDWPASVADNKGRTDFENRVDKNLPFRNLNNAPPAPTLKDAREFFLNYSTHVGDVFSTASANTSPDNKAGLANTDIVALYHSMLANKQTGPDGNINSPASRNKTLEPNRGSYKKPKRWPMYADWYHLQVDPTENDYDPLAVDRQDGTPKNAFIRDLEITVVAPNQFDTTYYSIEPDFYNNYHSKLTPQVIEKIKTNANVGGNTPRFPVDFGHPGKVTIDGIPNNFSVRHQVQIVKELFKDNQAQILGIHGINLPDFGFKVLSSKQSSVLTGWTFLNFLDFNAFPNEADPKYTMQFGSCTEDEELNPGVQDFKSLADAGGPATPGNCVTGGRTGYSVKLISSDLVKPGKIFKDLGGSGTSGEIKNPAPASFFNF